MIDYYLLAIVQLIVVIGLYELFIRAIDVPDWLRARSLDDLKEPIDALTYTGAVAILIAALSLYRLKPSKAEPTRSTGSTSPEDRDAMSP